MKFDMLKDLSNVTGVKHKTLQTVLSKQNKLIAHDVYLSGDEIAEIDIGIGILQIKAGEEDCVYRFIPCAKLQQTMAYMIKNGEDVLVTALEKSVSERFERTYRDMF